MNLGPETPERPAAAPVEIVFLDQDGQTEHPDFIVIDGDPGRVRLDDELRSVQLLLAYMTTFLMGSVALAWGLLGSSEGGAAGDDASRTVAWVGGVELFDAFLVALAAWHIGSPPGLGDVLPKRRRAAWLAAAPILAVALAVNFAFHDWLRSSFNLPLLDDPLVSKTDFRIWAVVLVCLQPAIVEELFFRWLWLGSLRPIVGMHAAVWISSLFFGLAHVHDLVATPYLVLLGAGLGYARVASRSLALPMILHFLHNAVVLMR